MPHFAVLQPNKKLAVYSTIVDNFTAFDCTPEEATAEIARWHTGDLSGHVNRVLQGQADEENRWNERVAWSLYLNGAQDSSVIIAMKMTPDADKPTILARAREFSE